MAHTNSWPCPQCSEHIEYREDCLLCEGAGTLPTLDVSNEDDIAWLQWQLAKVVPLHDPRPHAVFSADLLRCRTDSSFKANCKRCDTEARLKHLLTQRESGCGVEGNANVIFD